MKKTLTNAQMAGVIQSLTPILQQRNKLGYVAARNYRNLDTCLTEYKTFRDDLIKKYGERGDDGTYSIKIHTPEFEKFSEELEPFNKIEHEVELMTAKYTDAIDILSGEEILAIDWMLED